MKGYLNNFICLILNIYYNYIVLLFFLFQYFFNFLSLAQLLHLLFFCFIYLLSSWVFSISQHLRLPTITSSKKKHLTVNVTI